MMISKLGSPVPKAPSNPRKLMTEKPEPYMRLRRMKDRLREMSHWCQQLMREDDLMEDEDEQQQAVEEEAKVQAVDTTDQDFHNNTGAAEQEPGTCGAQLKQAFGL